MKCIISIILVVNGLFVCGQSRKFIERASVALQEVDTTFEIVTIEPSLDEYDFLSLGNEDIEKIFLSELKDYSKVRPDELRESQTLSTLTAIATESWKGSHYVDAKKWKGLTKYFKRAASRSATKFNIMQEVSFRIPLVDNLGKKFYYDKRGGSESLSLYSGDFPKNSEDRQETDAIPLHFFSEEALAERFMNHIRRKRLASGLKKGQFSFAGISVVIDERTLHKKRIPTARVVVVLGARRLQKVKPKKEEI